MERTGGGRGARAGRGGRRRPVRPGPAGPRAPAQARGQRRVDGILDAAAALIQESGVGGLTVHGVAERAHTSIGSMYHFFPDLDAVMAGLIERHLRGFEPIVSALAARDRREWSRMSAAAVVDAIVAPIFAYLRRHPDTLVLNAAPEAGKGFGKRREELKNAALNIIERILVARSPSVRPEVRRARAAVMVGNGRGRRDRPRPQQGLPGAGGGGSDAGDDGLSRGGGGGALKRRRPRPVRPSPPRRPDPPRAASAPRRRRGTRRRSAARRSTPRRRTAPRRTPAPPPPRSAGSR